MGDARAVRCGLPPREGELRDEEHPGGGRLRSCEPGLPPRVRVARLPPLGRHGGQRVRPDDHFVPVKPFSDGLFPTETHKKKVWISAAGVLAVIGALTFASTKVGFLRSSCSTCCPTWPATSGSCSTPGCSTPTWTCPTSTGTSGTGSKGPS